jgi:hypothetical protein
MIGWGFAEAADYLGPRHCVTSLRLVDMHILVDMVLFKNHVAAWFGSSCSGSWRCCSFLFELPENCKVRISVFSRYVKSSFTSSVCVMS